MLYIDAELQFSDNQAVAAAADSDNVIDLGGADIGKGESVYLYVHANGYTGGTLKVDLKTSNEVAGQNLSSPTNLVSFEAGADAMAKGGQVIAAALPVGCKRYLRLAYTPDGGGADGKITAGLNMGPQTNP